MSCISDATMKLVDPLAENSKVDVTALMRRALGARAVEAHRLDGRIVYENVPQAIERAQRQAEALHTPAASASSARCQSDSIGR